MKESELNYFKELLEERKRQIEENMAKSKAEMDALKRSEANDEADYATINSDSAVEQALSTKQRTELKEIEYALHKIKNGTYGICEMCEEPIGTQRLKVKPQAKYCIVCREIVEKSS